MVLEGIIICAVQRNRTLARILTYKLVHRMHHRQMNGVLSHLTTTEE